MMSDTRSKCTDGCFDSPIFCNLSPASVINTITCDKRNEIPVKNLQKNIPIFRYFSRGVAFFCSSKFLWGGEEDETNKANKRNTVTKQLESRLDSSKIVTFIYLAGQSKHFRKSFERVSPPFPYPIPSSLLAPPASFWEVSHLVVQALRSHKH